MFIDDYSELTNLNRVFVPNKLSEEPRMSPQTAFAIIGEFVAYGFQLYDLDLFDENGNNLTETYENYHGEPDENFIHRTSDFY